MRGVTPVSAKKLQPTSTMVCFQRSAYSMLLQNNKQEEKEIPSKLTFFLFRQIKTNTQTIIDSSMTKKSMASINHQSSGPITRDNKVRSNSYRKLCRSKAIIVWRSVS